MEATSVGELILGAIVFAGVVYGLLKMARSEGKSKSGGSGGSDGPPKKLP